MMKKYQQFIKESTFKYTKDEIRDLLYDHIKSEGLTIEDVKKMSDHINKFNTGLAYDPETFINDSFDSSDNLNIKNDKISTRGRRGLSIEQQVQNYVPILRRFYNSYKNLCLPDKFEYHATKLEDIFGNDFKYEMATDFMTPGYSLIFTIKKPKVTLNDICEINQLVNDSFKGCGLEERKFDIAKTLEYTILEIHFIAKTQEHQE